MSAADAVYWLIVAGLAAYVVFAGADFGAGAWDLAAGWGRRGDHQREVIHRSMGPVWEANHVWLIFVLVMAWTGFPTVFAAVMTGLTVPLSLGLLGIVLRGAAFAFTPHVTGARRRAMDALFGASSVLAPFMFGSAAGAMASGRVEHPTAGRHAQWLTATPPMVGVLAVALCAYLAAVFLTADAARRGDRDTAEGFRRRALVTAAVTGALALATPLVARADAPHVWDALTGRGGLAMVALSVLTGLVAVGALWARRHEAARAAAGLTVGVAVAGWGLVQHPGILPGDVRVDQAAAAAPVLSLLLWTVGVGSVILVPSLVLLYRLMLTGRVAPAPAEDDA